MDLDAEISRLKQRVSALEVATGTAGPDDGGAQPLPPEAVGDLVRDVAKIANVMELLMGAVDALTTRVSALDGKGDPAPAAAAPATDTTSAPKDAPAGTGNAAPTT